MMAEKRIGEAAYGKMHVYESLPSTFDKAFELISRGELEEWESVLAITQTNGIGQLRRAWQSPPGNLYVSFRLPSTSPFDSIGAAVVVGFFCARALRALGWPIMIKWPNDLVLPENGNPCKAGGILLEEKGGALVAGIGINLISAPKNLRDGAAMPATFLFAMGGLDSLKNPEILWNAILTSIREEYQENQALSHWNNFADDLLLWRGMEVLAEDGAAIIQGRFMGVAASGAALIHSGDDIREIDNGSMRLAESGIF